VIAPWPEVEPPRSGSLEARTSLALKILAGIYLAGTILAFVPETLPVSSYLTVAFNTVAVALAVLYVGEAFGLDRRRPWAVAAARPLLVILLASGIYSVAAALGAGRMKIPFDGILAVWALLAPGDVSLRGEVGGRSLGLVGVTLGLLAVLQLATPIFGWNGLLDIHQQDLHASTHVDCGPPGGGLPAKIRVTYDWSWSSRPLIPSGLDSVVIGWDGDDGVGRPLYVLDETPPTAVGIRSGQQEDPSADMARQVEGETRASWHWGVATDKQRFAPGHIELVLMRPRDAPPEPEALTVRASYIHVGVWRSHDPAVVCHW
jgi:hypothetical protein